MSEYFLILLSSAIVPFVFSFEKKLKFYKKIHIAFIAILPIALIFLIWDYFFTKKNFWGFSKKYISGYYVLNLPIEEVLFFIIIPYCSLFIYATVRFYLKDKNLNIDKNYFRVLSILSFVVSLILPGGEYTFVVFIFFGLFFLIYPSLNFKTLISSNFWITMIITYLPFIIVNYLLTSPPIVWYNYNSILGDRFLTIPIEDFFYSFILLGSVILNFDKIENICTKRKLP